MTIEIFLQVANTGALAYVAFAFMKGTIWSDKSVDKMLEANKEQTVKLADEVKKGIKEAVTDGIVAGVYQAKNGVKK